MIRTYQGAISAPVTLPFLADLGGSAKSGSLTNTGPAAFAVVYTLDGVSTAPFTLPGGSRVIFPCDLDSLTITPVDEDAQYQVAAAT